MWQLLLKRLFQEVQNGRGQFDVVNFHWQDLLKIVAPVNYICVRRKKCQLSSKKIFISSAIWSMVQRSTGIWGSAAKNLPP